MSLNPKGPVDYPLGDLHPDQFEVLVYLLVRDEFPGAVQVRAYDHGLDVRLPDPAGATPRGWQAKRFTGAIKWGQCQESTRRAIAFWRPLHVTFAFPKTLSGKEQDDFRKKLIEQFPRVRLDWWGSEDLQARMRDTEGGRRAAAWLFENLEDVREKMQRAIAVGGELEDSGQAAARAAAIQEFVDRDPHFRYTIVSADEEAPTTPPATETIISFQASFGSKAVRFDASERYPGASADAGLAGHLILSDDDSGASARETLQRAADGEDAVTISAGLAARFDSVPVGLRGLMPEGLHTGTFEIGAIPETDSSSPPQPSGMPVLVRSGGCEVGIVLSAVEPQDGETGLLVGSVGGLELNLRFHGRPGDGQIEMNWRWTAGEGSAIEQLLAAQVLLAGHRGEPVEIFDPTLDRVVVSTTPDTIEERAERIAEIESVIDYLEIVSEVETWIGEPLPAPAVPAESDVRTLGELLGRIRNPNVEGTWERIEMVLTAETDLDVFQVAVISPVDATLFGRSYYVGGELVRIPKARFAEFAGEPQIGDSVAIVPADDNTISVLFQPPAQAPEEAVRRR